jgi:hypothetical protein
VPYYVGGHYDSILDAKLRKEPNLLHLTEDLYAHFASSLRYSTQALPVNTLLDTLIRPNADTELNPTSCVQWRYEPEKAVSHVAIGDTEHAGGQWADKPVSASADIGTLSYAEQLSLPGYSYEVHLAKRETQDQCDFVRPSRAEVADYLRAYPAAAGIADSVFAGTKIEDVRRTKDGFVIGSLGIRCKHLVLASGTFSVNIPPPLSLAPVAQLNNIQHPLLVIGSGFSAADVIISAPATRRIIHIFQWAPEKRPSPLRACHHTAYPEYATVYRQMKLAAIVEQESHNEALSDPAQVERPCPEPELGSLRRSTQCRDHRCFSFSGGRRCNNYRAASIWRANHSRSRWTRLRRGPTRHTRLSLNRPTHRNFNLHGPNPPCKHSNPNIWPHSPHQS